MKKRNFILITAIVCTAIMILVDLIVKPPYFLKSIIKIILFGGSVLAFSLLHKEKPEFFKMQKKAFLTTLLLSAAVYGVILLAYRLTSSFIDYSNISSTLTSTIGVNKENFIFVSLYISFINSLLEEIFFRGYCFLTLRKHTNPKFSFLFSAGLFALYHGGVLDGWFNIFAYVLMLALLFLAGLFFNALDHKTESILPSWLPHMFANFGINTVGFMLFGLL